MIYNNWLHLIILFDSRCHERKVKRLLTTTIIFTRLESAYYFAGINNYSNAWWVRLYYHVKDVIYYVIYVIIIGITFTVFNCSQFFFRVYLLRIILSKCARSIKSHTNKPRTSLRLVGTTENIITTLRQPADRDNQPFEQTSQLGGLWRQQQCQCQSRHSPADGAPHVAYVWRCTRRSARTPRPNKGDRNTDIARLIGTFI